jgi:hypothetical protein
LPSSRTGIRHLVDPLELDWVHTTPSFRHSYTVRQNTGTQPDSHLLS